MFINRLELHDFRNYVSATVDFAPGTNVIYGNNAQGKTNIVEALYLFALGKSFRTTQDRDLIRFGCEYTRLTVCFTGHGRENSIEITVRRDRKKQVKVNGVGVTRLGELIGQLDVVLFYPEELNLIKEGPSLRRRFLDIAISQLRPKYYYLLSKYNKILEQRNNLIKKIKFHGYARDTLPIWNERLADYGDAVIRYRKKYIAELAVYAARVHGELSGEELTVAYRSRLEGKEDFLQKLTANFDRELEHGATLYGPHRDDLDIYINGLDAKSFASQGQQRTCVLSLKLAQADYLHDKLGEYPVLLLDDILSELDFSRRQYLLERIRDKQVILTCTDVEAAERISGNTLFVQNGTILKK